MTMEKHTCGENYITLLDFYPEIVHKKYLDGVKFLEMHFIIYFLPNNILQAGNGRHGLLT